MTDQTNAPAPAKDELTLLKERAATMGITHSNNITVETLKKKIEDHMAGVKPEPQTNPFQETAVAPAAPEKFDMIEFQNKLIADATRLVRVRIANLDPKKKDIPGEVITVANEYIGTVKKYVPFGEQTDEGYHIPYCIYEFLKSREFLQITTKRDRKTGTNETRTRYVKEFAIEVLEPLTQEELDRLANAQAAAGVFGSDD